LPAFEAFHLKYKKRLLLEKKGCSFQKKEKKRKEKPHTEKWTDLFQCSVVAVRLNGIKPSGLLHISSMRSQPWPVTIEPTYLPFCDVMETVLRTLEDWEKKYGRDIVGLDT